MEVGYGLEPILPDGLVGEIALGIRRGRAAYWNGLLRATAPDAPREPDPPGSVIGGSDSSGADSFDRASGGAGGFGRGSSGGGGASGRW